VQRLEDPTPPTSNSPAHRLTLVVAALGYFVDLFDLWLFSLYRLEIFTDLSIPDPVSSGVWTLNAQLAGLLIGGVLFGWLANRTGRPRALLLSILIYSLGTFLLPLAQDITELAILRLITGIGLAGELGIAATLLFEMVTPQKRWIASLGLILVGLWGSLAAVAVTWFLSWRWAFTLGGLLGLALLLFRGSIQESPLFAPERSGTPWRLLRSNRHARQRLLALSLIGLPITAIFWMVTSFSPELSTELGFIPAIPVARTLLWMQTGYILGDVASILLSHYLRKRRLVVGLSLTGCMICLVGLCFLNQGHTLWFLGWALALGLSAGFWGVLLTTCIEQFGTDMRAGAATLVPNLARAAPLLLLAAFGASAPVIGIMPSILALGLLSVAGAAYGLSCLQESFGTSLDWTEEGSTLPTEQQD
jgi:putative MFS transporter